MSWSFSAKGHPKEVVARADHYFSQPYIGTMAMGERVQVLCVHQQICLAAENPPDDYELIVNAYGSQSTFPNGKVINTVSCTIGCEKKPEEATKSK